MKESINKSKENESQSIAISSIKEEGVDQTAPIVDNSPEAIQMRAFQSDVDNSPETLKELEWQNKIDENTEKESTGSNDLSLETNSEVESSGTVKHHQFKGADEETHTLYTEGKEGEERLMMASTPQEFLQVLRVHKENHMSYYKDKGLNQVLLKAIKRSNELISHYAISKTRRDETTWDNKKNQLIASLIKRLKVLGSHLMWNSTDWTVDWIKPPTANYPPIWIGPEVEGNLLQETLAWYRYNGDEESLLNVRKLLKYKEWEDWVGDKEDASLWDYYWEDTENNLSRVNITWPAVDIYKPETGGNLPDGTQIGLDNSNKIYNHKKFDIDGNMEKTPSGGKINKALKPYGFAPILEKLDGDHAVEAQLGGEDEIGNLWPLEQAPNRAGGVWLNTSEVYDGNGNTMPYPVLMDLVRIGGFEDIKLWINIINNTSSKRWNWI